MVSQTTITLTPEELKTLVRDAVHEAIVEVVAEIITPRMDALAVRLEDKMEDLFLELEQQLPDPDEGLELSPQFAARLRTAMREKGKRKLHSHDDVERDLGLSK